MQYRPQWPCSAMRSSCITWQGVMFLKSINSREYLITTFTLFYVYWFKILVSWDRCKFDKSGRWFCFFLFLAQYITGTCPEGFAPGTYGIGSCYIVHRELLQMAEAVIKCRDLYAARLLNIQSQQEDSFIKSFLLNTSSSGDMIFISVFIFASVAYNFHFLYISYHLFKFNLSHFPLNITVYLLFLLTSFFRLFSRLFFISSGFIFGIKVDILKSL